MVAKHDAPVRHCFYVKGLGSGMLVTGGWDKTIRYWDLRCRTFLLPFELRALMTS